MAEELELVLSARIREFLTGTRQAAKAAVELAKDVGEASGTVTATVEAMAEEAGRALREKLPAGAKAGARKVVEATGDIGAGAAKAADQVEQAAKQAAGAFDTIGGAAEKAAKRAKGALDDIGDEAKRAANDVKKAGDEAAASFDAAFSRIAQKRKALGGAALAETAKTFSAPSLETADFSGFDRISQAQRSRTSGALSEALQTYSAAAKKSINDLAGEIGEAVGGFAQRVRSAVFSVEALVASAGVAAGAKAAVSAAADFETQLANVDTLLDDSSVSVERYREQLLELSGRSTKDLADLTQGLYQTISAGIPAVEGAGGALSVLDTAQRAATAGLSTTEQAVTALTTVLNVYGAEAGSVTDISDKLLLTVNRGVTTFPELASSLGQVLSVAKGFGVGFDEVLGIVTALTKAGFSTSEAVTSLRQALVSAARPPKQVADAAKEMGVELGITALRSKGLVGILEQITEKTGGSAEAITKLFTDVDGLKGVLALTSKGLADTRGEIDAVAGSAGATARAISKFEGTFNASFATLKNQARAVLIEIGDAILPSLQQALTDLGSYLVTNKDEIVGAVKGFVDGLFAAGRFVAEHGRELITFVATFFAVSTIRSASQALAGFAERLTAIAATAAATQAAGVSAGTSFVAGFGRGLAGIAGTLSTVLRSAGVIGAVVGAAVFIGEALGNAIGRHLAAGITAAGEEARRNAAEIEAQIRERLKNAGAGSVDELAAAKKRLNAGEVVDLGGQGKIADFKTPVEALASDAAKARAAFEKRLAELQAEQADAARIGADLGARLPDVQARSESGGLAGAVAADTLDALQKDVQAQQARFVRTVEAEKKLRAAIAAAEAAVAAAASAPPGDSPAPPAAVGKATDLGPDDDESALDEAAALAAKALAKAAEEAAKRRREGEEAAAEARLRLTAAQLEAERGRIEAEEALNDEATAGRLAGLGRIGATQAEIRSAEVDGLERASQLLGQRIDLERRAGEAAIASAREEARQRIEAVQGSADAEAAIREELAARIAAIDAETGNKIAALDRQGQKNAGERAELTRPRTPLEGIAEGRLDGFNAGAVAGAEVLNGGLGAIGADAAIGPAAAVLGFTEGVKSAAQNVVGTLNDLGNFFRDGITTFATEFGAAIENFADGLLNLPDQVDRLLGEQVPEFIEKFIERLPEVIAGLIALQPRLIAAQIKAIPQIVKAFGLGFAEAGREVWRGIVAFFKTSVGRVFADIGKGIGDLFAKLYDTLFKGIVDAFIEAGRELVRAFERAVDAVTPDTGLSGAIPFAGGPVSEKDKAAGAEQRRQQQIQDVVRQARGPGKAGAVADLAGLGVSPEEIARLLGVSQAYVDQYLPRFNAGGAVSTGRRNTGLASAFADMGALAFASGGRVPTLEDISRRSLSAAMRGDVVPALLAPGEHVLTQRGVQTLGGHGAASLANMGVPPQGTSGPMTAVLNIEARDAATEALVRLLLGRVSVSLQSPSGTVGAALDRRQVGTGQPPGARPVRART